MPAKNRLFLYRVARRFYGRAGDLLEAEQALIRFAVGAGLITYVYLGMPTPELRLTVLHGAVVYALFSGLMTFWLVVAPNASNCRRVAGICGDVLGAAMFSYQVPKDFLYMFTWTVMFSAIGNGFRYSAHHLKLVTSLGVGVLIAFHFHQVFWGQSFWHWSLAVIFLLLLSAYVLKFIRERTSSEALLEKRTGELEAQTLALRAAKDELEHALRARENFLSKVSHELRTPLHTLVQLLQGARRESRRPEAGELQAIWVCAELIQDQVGNLLDLADGERTSGTEVAEVFDIRNLLQGMVVAVELEARRKGLRVSLVAADELDTLVRAPGEAIRQIVWNLLTNSVKFTDVGSITVVLSEDCARCERGRKLRISVQDTGIGISEEDLGRIWEPFFQVSDTVGRSRGGTGLGLAIAKGRASRISGELRVASQLGWGSKFEFIFSTDELTEQEQQAVREPRERLLATQPPLRILIAEDDYYSRVMIERALERAGHTVVACVDGAQALAALKDQGSFDIGIIDQHLPTMEGPQVVGEYLRSLPRDGVDRVPRLVMWTAGLTAKSRDEALRAGFDQVFTKHSGWWGDLAEILKSAAKRAALEAAGGIAPATIVKSEMDTEEQHVLRWTWRDVAPETLYRKYVGSVEKAVQQIDRALDEGELNRAWQLVHRIRGQSALFGSPVEKMIATFQLAMRDGDVSEIARAWEATKNEIRTFVSDRSPPDLPSTSAP